MSELVAVKEGGAVVEAGHFTSAQVEVLKRTVCKDATPDELAFFGQVCRAKKLDPFGQQIFLVKRNDRDGGKTLSIQTGIDGFRAIAARSGEYAGNDEPKFEYEGNAKTPSKASVTVYRLIQGQRIPFTASAYWAEFYPGEKMGFMWRSKPHVMLGKCAEAQALRKAFPNECGGIYETSEVEYQPEVSKPVQIAADLNQRFATKAPHAAQNAVALATVQQVQEAVAAFAKIGITAEQVKEKLGKDDGVTVADMETLRAWYNEVAVKGEADAD